MKLKLYILPLLIVVLWGCKKEIPIEIPTTKGEVVFAVTGSCLGYNINYQAGENDYYMYTDYKQYNASPYNFVSVLRKNSCGTICPYSVGITLTAATNGISSFDVNQSINDSIFYNFYVDTTGDSLNFNPSQINAFFTDINGTKFESKNVQFQNGYFNILSVQDFDNNELGQKTKKVFFELSCLVSSQYTFQSSDSLVLSGSFAFAYPSP